MAVVLTRALLLNQGIKGIRDHAIAPGASVLIDQCGMTAVVAHRLHQLVEIRDAAIAVRLTDTSSHVYAQDGRATAAVSPLTTALAESASLTTAEEVVRRICGISEIDYERTKAKILRTPTRPSSHDELGHRLESYSRSARYRGVDYITYRRLAEACGASIGEVRAVASPIERSHRRTTVIDWCRYGPLIAAGRAKSVGHGRAAVLTRPIEMASQGCGTPSRIPRSIQWRNRASGRSNGD